MSLNFLLALAGFALVTSVTPGPNNMMLLASGVNFGFRRTIPHMLGIGIGFIVMLLIVGLGVGQLLTATPLVYNALRIASVLYMLWLAWKIAISGPIDGMDGASTGRPMTFVQGALFQWVNPKAWAIALPGTTTYTDPQGYLPSLLALCALFAIVNIPSLSVWTLFGVGLREMLKDGRKVRIFNIVMAVLLVASMAPAVIELMRR